MWLNHMLLVLSRIQPQTQLHLPSSIGQLGLTQERMPTPHPNLLQILLNPGQSKDHYQTKANLLPNRWQLTTTSPGQSKGLSKRCLFRQAK
jgi:hypothetical protein